MINDKGNSKQASYTLVYNNKPFKNVSELLVEKAHKMINGGSAILVSSNYPPLNGYLVIDDCGSGVVNKDMELCYLLPDFITSKNVFDMFKFEISSAYRDGYKEGVQSRIEGKVFVK